MIVLSLKSERCLAVVKTPTTDCRVLVRENHPITDSAELRKEPIRRLKVGVNILRQPR
jgi:hypothetical protein